MHVYINYKATLHHNVANSYIKSQQCQSETEAQKKASKAEQAIPLHLSMSSPRKKPPSIKLFVYFALMFHSCPKIQSSHQTTPFHKHSALSRSSRQLLKGSSQLLHFTLRGLHQSCKNHLRDQRCCMTHFESLTNALWSRAKRIWCRRLPPSVNHVSRTAMSYLLSWTFDPSPYIQHIYTHIHKS